MFFKSFSAEESAIFGSAILGTPAVWHLYQYKNSSISFSDYFKQQD
jgi:hypothetical protein